MTAGAAPSMPQEASGHALEQALRARGIACAVEVHEGMAILRPRARPLADLAALRRDVIALARAHGFSHIALEL